MILGFTWISQTLASHYQILCSFGSYYCHIIQSQSRIRSKSLTSMGIEVHAIFSCTTKHLSSHYQALVSFVSCAIITLSWYVKRPWMNLVFPSSTLNEFAVSYFHDMSGMECLWICILTLEEDKVKETKLPGSLSKRTTKLRIKKTKVNI